MQLIFNSDGLDVRTKMAEVHELIDEKSISNGVTDIIDKNEKAINGIINDKLVEKSESTVNSKEQSLQDINSDAHDDVVNGDKVSDEEISNLEEINVNIKQQCDTSEKKKDGNAFGEDVVVNVEQIEQKIEEEHKTHTVKEQDHDEENGSDEKINSKKNSEIVENNEEDVPEQNTDAEDECMIEPELIAKTNAEVEEKSSNENVQNVDVIKEQDVEDRSEEEKCDASNKVIFDKNECDIENEVTDIDEKMDVENKNNLNAHQESADKSDTKENENSEKKDEHTEQMDIENINDNVDNTGDRNDVDSSETHIEKVAKQADVEETIDNGEKREDNEHCDASDQGLKSAAVIENLVENVESSQELHLGSGDENSTECSMTTKKDEVKEENSVNTCKPSNTCLELNEKNTTNNVGDIEIINLEDNITKEQSITIDDTDSANIKDVDEKKIKESEDPDCSLRLDNSSDDDVVCQEEVDTKNNDTVKETQIDESTEPMDVDKIEENDLVRIKNTITEEKTNVEPLETKRICSLSNNLDILSDDDELTVTKPESLKPETTSLHCINLDDDDCVMLVDDVPTNTNETNVKDDSLNKLEDANKNDEDNAKLEIDLDSSKNETMKNSDSLEEKPVKFDENSEVADKKLTSEAVEPKSDKPQTMEVETLKELEIKDDTAKKVEPKPLVPANFLRKFKANLGEMTREELEEFCLMQIVEGVVDRSNLSEIKSKIKIMSQSMDEWRNKNLALTKQNRDLQIILKTVQEELKKPTYGHQKITPLKITRSVGLQVCLADKNQTKQKKAPPANKPRPPQLKTPENPNQNNIPVPRLVPASSANPPSKPIKSSPLLNPIPKPSSLSLTNGGRYSTVAKQNQVDKRPFSSVQSDTVDLTDDEPPAKQMTVRIQPKPPVRLVSQNQLLTPRAQRMNSPRKVFIPVGGQAVNRPGGQTIMLKQVGNPIVRQQRPSAPMVRINTTAVRVPRDQNMPSHPWHPAPLPEATNQQQSPLWKALPPAPDLTISKVENGIVISWKITGYQEDSYESIASYQLYAYQETKALPNTALWKKIGDVKALPLPMACTLTQFMSGYKYYFAVRAVDIKSRIGPFSLPGSILLLNK